MKRYLDYHMEAKRKVPSPDKYECNAHRPNFNDVAKKSKIYCHDRKSSVVEAIKESSKLPGVARYKIDTYDEARCKPPRGYSKVKDEKYSKTDEAVYASKLVPFHINDTNMVSLLKIFPNSNFIFYRIATTQYTQDQ